MACIVSLALGVGISTAAFSFLDTLFLRPPAGTHDAARVVKVFSEEPAGLPFMPVSYRTFEALSERARAFSHTAASQYMWVVLGTHDRPERLLGEIVTAGYFETLGVALQQGRTFSPREGDPSDHAQVAILSHLLWQEHFGADPGILGNEIVLNGRKYEVIGIAPEGFQGINLFNAPKLWLPMSMYEEVFVDPEMFESDNGRVLQVIARLAAGATFEGARAEAASVASQLREAFPEAYQNQELSLLPVTDAQVYPTSRARFRRAGLFLLLVGGVLLASACVNVANLLLLEAVQRAREFAVRLSLGARRRQLLLQLVMENLLLACLGGALGLLVAYAAWKLMWRFRPPYFDQDAFGLTLDAKVLFFTLSVSIVIGFLFGLAPILHALHSDPSEILKDQTGTILWHGLRVSPGSLLVVLQVSLSTILLMAAGASYASLTEVHDTDLGFRGDQLLTLSWDLQSGGYPEERARSFERQVVERVSALPGVEAVTLGENRPLGGFRLLRRVSAWEDAGTEDSALTVGSSMVDPSYFSVLSLPLAAGRSFTDRDRRGTMSVAIVNQQLASLLSPNDPSSMVGAEIRIDEEPEPVVVVGVAETVKHIHPSESPRPALYLPLLQRFTPRAALHVRAAGDPAKLVETVRREVQSLDPALPLLEVGTLSQHLSRALWAVRMNVVLLGTFGIFALILTSIGIYSVMAYSVAQQQREIGIRMALGARRQMILRQVVSKGVLLVTVGIGTGILTSLGLHRWVGSLVSGLQQANRTIVLLTAVTILMIGVIANLAPAFRAARIDPAEGLRL